LASSKKSGAGSVAIQIERPCARELKGFGK
jgi:hypothetical protein